MINVDNITIQFSQVLDTGEDQTLIVDHDGETASMSTDAWTLGDVTLTDITQATDEALATARIHLRVLQLENKP